MVTPIHEDAHSTLETRPIEMTITLKGEDSTYKQKHLLYESLDALRETTVLKLIETARMEYQGEIDEVIVGMRIQWQ